MRPPDENQSTSMRPNLISPRRSSAGGEDSILAMLEREPARKRGQRNSGARLAWYGASAAVALALTGALVWMAANNDGRRPGAPETVLAEAVQAPPQEKVAAGDSRTEAATVVRVALAPAPEAQPASAARIVEQPPAEAAPPLRLLTPVPQRPAAEIPRLAPRTGVSARPAAMQARPRASIASRDAPRPAKSKARRGPHPGTAAAPAAPVDADVALISAVIVHANGHAPEGSQMTELLCPNDACKNPSPRR